MVFEAGVKKTLPPHPVLRRQGGETTDSARQIQDRRAAGHPRGGRHIDE